MLMTGGWFILVLPALPKIIETTWYHNNIKDMGHVEFQLTTKDLYGTLLDTVFLLLICYVLYVLIINQYFLTICSSVSFCSTTPKTYGTQLDTINRILMGFKWCFKTISARGFMGLNLSNTWHSILMYLIRCCTDRFSSLLGHRN